MVNVVDEDESTSSNNDDVDKGSLSGSYSLQKEGSIKKTASVASTEVGLLLDLGFGDSPGVTL